MESGHHIHTGSFPWYRSHARGALAVACALFVLVSVARLFANGTGQAVDILYSLPIAALVAMAFGLRGGVTAAAVGFVLFAALEVTDGVGDIDATGWIVRGAGLLLLGLLLGRATDQIEAGEARTAVVQQDRRRLAERARRQAEALEISDSILQHLAVAKWKVESGQDDEAIDILTSTLTTGQRMVADLLPVQHGSDRPGSDRPGSASGLGDLAVHR